MNLDNLEITSDSNFTDEDEIDRRYDNRPGYQLVSWFLVGLPVARITVTALTLRRKPIPPIEEFVLKAISVGLSSLEDICSFLGLEKAIIEDAIINLRQNENIDLVASEGSLMQEWKLTKKGEKTLSEARIIVPEERSYTLNFDKMLWKPHWYGEWELNARLIRPRDLKTQNMIEIPYYPTRIPELADLKLKEVESIIHEATKRNKYKKEEERDFIGLKSIERRENLFQPAFALVYQQKESNDIEMAFAIDERLSDEHESAFKRAKGNKKEQIFKQLRERISSQLNEAKIIAEETFGKELITEASYYDKEISSIEKQINAETGKLNLDVNFTRQQIETVDNEEQKQALENNLKLALKKIEELEEQLNSVRSSVPLRFLKTYEHRPLLEEALQESQKRLLIIAPWIRANATNQWLINKIETLLKRGVKVFIGYGFGEEQDESRQDYDVKAEDAIKRLAARYQENFVLKRLGDTHCKILISDLKFAIVGSFNWLSYKGDPNRTFRDERSTIVFYPQKIDELFENEVKRLKE